MIYPSGREMGVGTWGRSDKDSMRPFEVHTSSTPHTEGPHRDSSISLLIMQDGDAIERCVEGW